MPRVVHVNIGRQFLSTAIRDRCPLSEETTSRKRGLRTILYRPIEDIEIEYIFSGGDKNPGLTPVELPVISPANGW